MSDRTIITSSYIRWMCDLDTNYSVFNIAMYTRLLTHLNTIPFEYFVDHDDNRYVDGINLRVFFESEMNYPEECMDDFMSKPCSVLEMMVALAHRCEEQIMADPEYGNRTGLWFWEMLVSLGLSNETNDIFSKDRVDRIITRFLRREYAPNGKGGLYTIHTQEDIRGIEIWYQMMLHLDEICSGGEE